MDNAVPPASPIHHGLIQPYETTEAFARGDAPRWTLTEVANGIVLALGTAQEIRFGRGVWRATPRGRVLTATGPGGTMQLLVNHGRSRDGRGRLAALTWNGRIMPGRLLETGDRPYDGGG